MNDNPKVFISHASEDKERFVLPFAKRLRAKGVDAWVDLWEMLPGDSLVDKIFNEGLKPADAVVVVLSKTSIKKPWVQKEMNTAVVKSIEDRTRLIAVRLDDCEMPECLRDTLYYPIRDLSNYDDAFARIVAAIYGQYDSRLSVVVLPIPIQKLCRLGIWPEMTVFSWLPRARSRSIGESVLH